MAASGGEWLVGEDGCLSVGEATDGVTYHPTLNILLVLTKEPAVKVLDVNSGILLQKSTLSATPKSTIQCLYLSAQDKILVTDGSALGLRRDHCGVLLLDTILLTPISKGEDTVKVELLLSEAVQLLKCLQSVELPGVENVAGVIKILEQQINSFQPRTKNNHKSTKWCTVCVEFSHSYLKSVSSTLVQELKRLNRSVPALAVAAAINERLNALLPETSADASAAATATVDRSLMFSESARRETFGKWPHMNYKWALPDQMAQAGFYHQPNSKGDDRAMCFTCSVCLVCWEPTDEPWSEHERHSPSCPFVKGEYTQNVPLSVTYAATPAKFQGKKSKHHIYLSTSSSPDLVATFNRSGTITVWNCTRQLKKEVRFSIDSGDPLLLTRDFSNTKTMASLPKQAWTHTRSDSEIELSELGRDDEPSEETESILAGRSSADTSADGFTIQDLFPVVRPFVAVRLSSVCVLSSPKTTAESCDDSRPSMPRTCILAGASLGQMAPTTPRGRLGTVGKSSNADDSPLVQVLNDVNEASSREMPLDIMRVEENTPNNPCSVPCILVYDICRQVMGNSVESKTASTAASLKKPAPTTSSGTQQESNPIYSNFNELLYDICDDPYDPICALNIVDMGPIPGFSNSAGIKFGGPSSSTSDLQNSDMTSIPTTTSQSDTTVIMNRLDLREKFHSAGLLTQCVELPECFRRYPFVVCSITPSFDRSFILVSVSTGAAQDDQHTARVTSPSNKVEELINSVNLERDNLRQASDSTIVEECSGGLILYKANYSSECVTLHEDPVVMSTVPSLEMCPKFILMLPPEATEMAEESDDQSGEEPTGHFVCITQAGSLKLHALSTLEVLAEFPGPEGQAFVSATYCASIERLCACTANGDLHFLHIWQSHEQENAESESKLESSKQSEDGTRTTLFEQADAEPESDLLINQSLTAETLLTLHELVQFENLTPRFSATTPSCWTEIQQEQKQRRHPQHLQQQGEAMQHTRSWRLQNDSNELKYGRTWDEHLFEITLPKSCCVGHIDFKFNLHPMCTVPPNIQITLLKQNTTGIGKNDNLCFNSEPVDTTVNFETFTQPGPSGSNTSSSSNNIPPSAKRENPVTSANFLDAHNAEILCGPLDLASYIDLSGQGGVVTLTSPELLDVSSRSFFIHLKSLPTEKEGSGKQELTTKPIQSSKIPLGRHYVVKVKDKSGGVPSLQSMLEYFAPPGSAVDRLAATATNKKTDNLKGCDWFHEVSITIRRTKKTRIPRERSQRAAVLRSVSFHRKLISIICRDMDANCSMCPEHRQTLALDILIWVAAVQMNNKTFNPEYSVLFTIQDRINGLIKSCFIDGGRTVAHKCAKLIVICLEHAKLMKNQDVAPIFIYTLLQELLTWLPMIAHCQSAGAVRWFFLLLNRVKCVNVAKLGQKCMELLVAIAKQYDERSSPLHSLLRSRFGLYGTPFEPELFDIEPSPCLKPSSTPISYASVVASSNANSMGGTQTTITSSPSDDLDLRDLLNLTSGDRSSTSHYMFTFPGQHLRGLLEVEPLHFTCHAASDGTKMEKIDAGSSVGNTTGTTLPLSANVFEQIPPYLHSAGGFSAWTGSLSTLFTTLKKKQEEFLKLQQQHKKLEQKLAETVVSPHVGIVPMNIKHVPKPYATKMPTGSGTIMVSMSSSTSANSAFSYQGHNPPKIPNSLGIEKTYIGTGELEDKLKNSTKTPSDQKKDTTNPGGNLLLSPWQQLLQPPPQQVLVIERMHSGARRFVVLDFGKLILLTDLMIPACSDLVSLSIDIWTQAEELDGQRLVVTTDIGVRSLVMCDLQPPPACRYLKITTIGRYGMSTTRCRIPIGMFYGHSFIFPWESGVKPDDKNSDGAVQEDLDTQIQPQLNALSSLLEDVHCRYSLACDKLFNLLSPLLPSEHNNSSHIHFYLQREKDKLSDEDQRVLSAYQECLQLQLQLNLVTNTMGRLERAQGLCNISPVSKSNHSDPMTANGALVSNFNNVCTDKLRVLSECLLDTLLGLTYPTPSIPQLPSLLYTAFDQKNCETLFRFLCVNGTRRMQLSCSTLLVRLCGLQPWWGSFVARMLVDLYNSEQTQLIPQDRVFILLTYLGQKALSNSSTSSVLESVIGLLEHLLLPLLDWRTEFIRGVLDLPLIGWVLLFLSVCLDNSGAAAQNSAEDGEGNKSVSNRDRDAGAVSSRWDFIQGEVAMLRNRTNNLKASTNRFYRRKLQKRLMHHKQQLEDLEQAKKAFIASTHAMSSLHTHLGGKSNSPAMKDLEVAVKQQEQLFKKTLKQHTAKHFKDIMQIRRTDGALLSKPGNGSRGSGSAPEREDADADRDQVPPLTRSQSLPVAKGLAALILAMDFTCNVDMFLLACKVLARITLSTRPAISLGEVLTQEQLRQLVQLCVGVENQAISLSWGGPWAAHAITCLLQDVLEGERLYPSNTSHETSPAEDDLVTLTSETDDSLQEAAAMENGDDVDAAQAVAAVEEQSADASIKFPKELPDLADSEDSESDDYNFDLFDSTNISKKIPFGPHKKSWSGIYNAIKGARMASKESRQSDLLSNSVNTTAHTVSTAVDARLEFGVEMSAELKLKVLTTLEADLLSNAIAAPLQSLPEGAVQDSIPEEIFQIRGGSMSSDFNNGLRDATISLDMLSFCFDQIFTQLQVVQVNLEALLQLWLTLTEDVSSDAGGPTGFDPGIVPAIPLSNSALSGLLSALMWYPTISLRTWCLAFQTLTLVSNLKLVTPDNSSTDSSGCNPYGFQFPSRRESSQDGLDPSQGWMAFSIVSDSNLLPVLIKFLSGTRLDNSVGTIKNNVGPTVTQALHDFLIRLQLRCDVITPESRLGGQLKELLLKIVHSLVSTSGAIQSCVGPLDAQCRFMELLLNLRFDNLDLNTAMSVIVATVMLVHNYIASAERVTCRSSIETGVNASSCFGGLFASVVRGEGGRSTASSSGNRDALVCNLLRLVTCLVQTPAFSVTHRNEPPNSRCNGPEVTNRSESPSATEASLTDSSKIEQQCAPGLTSFTDSSQTDEHKTAAGFTSHNNPKRCNHTGSYPGAPKVVYIADSGSTGRTSVLLPKFAKNPLSVRSSSPVMVLHHQATMLRLITSLASCTGSTMAMLLGVGGAYPSSTADVNERFVLGEPVSVGDSIFQLLCALNCKTSDIDLILQPLFTYISSGYTGQAPSHGLAIVPRLSEPLLWFLLRVLDCEEALEKFLQKGGIHVACKNLVHCNHQLINSHPSFVSTVMQYLSNGRATQATKRQGADLETVDGLLNFAPLGTISSSNPTAQPAEVLIQAAPPHRRARTPAWSYHFYPDESWVDLTITLPCAVLLKEIQIQPHLTSLATCPSAISVEVCRDGSSGSTPLCPPQPTNGLTFIRLQLTQPEIATAVTLRLHKPRDSSNIGLSQVLLLGSTTFGEAVAKSRCATMPSEDNVTRSSLGWLRIVHHCLTLPVSQVMQQQICAAAVSVPHLLNACCTLLLTPIMGVYMAHIEHVLLQLGVHSTNVGLMEIDILLHSTGWAHTQDILQHNFNSTALDSIVDIVYQLCTTQDSGTHSRVQAVLSWLGEVAQHALQQRTRPPSPERRLHFPSTRQLGNPPIAYVQCVAAILWNSHEVQTSFDLTSLLSVELICSVFEWSMSLPVKSALKRAVDLVLCSICYIRPEFFGYMLDWLGVTVSPSSTIPRPTSASISDDSKQQRTPLTDDIKEASHLLPQGTLNLNLNEAQLITLATVCQSPTAIRQLLDSGFPTALARIILEFCSLNKATVNVTNEPAQSDVGEDSTKFDNGSQPSTSFSFAKNGKAKAKPARPTTWSAVSDKQGWFPANAHGHQEGLTDAAKAGYPMWSNQNQENFSVSDYTHLLNGEFIAAALNFFTEVCNEGLTRDWLGGPEGSVFWLPLLNVLCDPVRRRVGTAAPAEKANVSGKSCCLSNAQRSSIEVAVLRLLTRCCWTHPTNQQLLAQVLCEVIRHQGSQHHIGSLGFLHAISGFTRRLILQLLLENEKIQVFVRSQHSLPKCSIGMSTNLPQHPRFGCGHCFRFLYVSTQTTCQEIVKNVSDSGISHLPAIPEVKDEKEVCKKDIAEIGLELVDHLSVAAGVTAKDKRQRDAKSSSSERTSVGRGLNASGPNNAACSSLALPTFVLTHDLLPGQPLPGPLTLAQLMTLLDDRGLTLSNASLTLTLTQTRKSKMEGVDLNSSVPGCLALLESNPLPTTLQVFASMGGLALLAQHLPLLYPEITRQTTPVPRPVSADRNATDLGTFLDNDWVKVEAADEINDDFLEFIPPGASTPQSARANQLPPPSIPPHSLAAFGLFLRLPGYAEVLLRERKKAQCLLRLALGITDNGEGGDIFQTSVAASLPTLPFQVLQQLFDATPLTTDDGMLLRRMTLDVGAIHLLFACLAVLSHQSGDINLPGFQQELVLAATRAVKTPQEMLGKSDDKSHLYWAKGTGFGTGSTNQSWDVEQAILRQRSEEEHVTCLLQVLASYINPGGQVPAVLGEKDDDTSTDEDNTQLSLLPPVFPELLSQSCLLPAICSYLRNDSVLDMARHIPLYRALLQLLRALAVSTQLVGMLLPSDNSCSENTLSICCLLTKMKSCVDIYASRLKTNKGKGNGKSSGKTTTTTPKTKEEEEENEGLAQLIPDIQETARIVQMATERLTMDQDDVTHDENHEKYSENSVLPKMITKTLDERYMEVMKRLQFESFEMIVEDEDTFRFTVTHHFEPNMRAAGDNSHPARARRLAQEAVTLSTSLPLSFSSSVFVRCDQDRLDIMKVLITGPAETPYANGCFEFDVYFPPDYPNSPMMINLETTGHHTVRFNPNLYNDGKVCLSVLNTWHGRPEEKWNPQTSSFLQVLVSIQSLILVQEPYFNEPGYERSRGTPSGTQSSREYDSNIRLATVKWAMLEQLRNPCICFKEAVQKHFWMKRCEIVRQIEGWVAEMDVQGNDRRAGRTIALNCVALKHHLAQLKEEFSKMKPPEGLEDLGDLLLDNGNAPPVTNNAASGSSEPQSSSVESSIQDSPDSNDASVGPV